MKLSHYLIPTIFAACGTTSSDEQPSGCQMDSDCKTGLICLEEKCTEMNSPDAAQSDSLSADSGQDPLVNLPLQGVLYATASVNGQVEAVVFDFDAKVVKQLGANGGLFDSAQARHLRNLNRPAIVGEKLIFVNNGEESVLQSYDLVRGDLITILKVYSGSEIAAKDDTSMFVSTQSHNNDGLDRVVVSEVALNGTVREVAGINAKSIFWGYMGVAFDKNLNQLYFTCPLVESQREEDQDDPGDQMYQGSKEICVTFGSQPDGSYHVMTNLKEEGVRMLSNVLTNYDFRGSNDKGVFFACASTVGNGFCSVREGARPVLEIPIDGNEIPRWLVFDPPQKYAALANGTIYGLTTEEKYNLNEMGSRLNGSNVGDVVPFAWK